MLTEAAMMPTGIIATDLDGQSPGVIWLGHGGVPLLLVTNQPLMPPSN
jgi:hypothetical protein